MEYHQGSASAGGDMANFQSGTSGKTVSGNFCPAPIDETVWATKDGLRNKEAFPDTNSESNDDEKLFQFQSGGGMPNKRPKNILLEELAAYDVSRAIAMMFYRTKECCEFRAGTCPRITGCHFAHGMEELRDPPPNWREIVAAYKGEPSEPREVCGITVVGSSDKTQGSNIGQHCEMFCNEGGGPYGENCMDQSKNQRSVAKILVSGSDGGYGNKGSKPMQVPFNWKTRICGKWEQTGYCRFGSNCRFAHGASELRGRGKAQVETAVKGSNMLDTNLVAGPAKASVNAAHMPLTSVPHSSHTGAPSRKSSNLVIPKAGEIPIRRWKGPDKISKIYGDWIDDL